jgi:hypothetical protein
MDRTDNINLLLALCLVVLGVAALTAAAELQRTDSALLRADQEAMIDRRAEPGASCAAPAAIPAAGRCTTG